VANISSVSAWEIPRTLWPAVVLLCFGAALIACSLAGMDSFLDGLLLGLVLAAFPALPGILILLLSKARYAVLVHSSSGEEQAWVSEDREYIVGIVEALNEAIVRRAQ